MRSMRLHPLTIMGINSLFPFLIAVFASAERMMFCVAFAFLVLLYVRQYRKAVITGGVMAGFFLAYIACMHWFPHPALVTFFRIGYMMAPCFLLAMALFSTYHTAELFAALEKLRLPKTFTIALAITLRYVPTFGREFKIIREAMVTRGVQASWYRPLRMLECYLVPQLFRCLALSTELASASLCRGVRSHACRMRYFDRPLTVVDYGALLLFFVGFFLV